MKRSFLMAATVLGSGLAVAAPAHATVFAGSAMFTDATTNNVLTVTANPNPRVFATDDLKAGQSWYMPGFMTLSTNYPQSGYCSFGCSNTDKIALSFTWTQPGTANSEVSGSVTETKTSFLFWTDYDGSLRWDNDTKFDLSSGRNYVAQTVTFANGGLAEVDLFDTPLTGTSSALAAQFDVRIIDKKDPTPVPEPMSLAILSIGLLGIGAVTRRKAG